MARVYLRPGHFGKPTRWDPGAVHTQNGKTLREAELALRYSTDLATELWRHRNIVLLEAAGSYGHSQVRARELGAHLYLNLHINSASARGEYGLVLYAEGSGQEEVAKELATALENYFLWAFHARPLKVDDRGGKLIWDAAINGGIPSFLLEPGFINNPDHMRTLRFWGGWIAEALVEVFPWLVDGGMP